MGAAKPLKRIDPKNRPVDGVDDWTVLRNRDPNRFYIGALASNRGMFDVEYYESLAEGLEIDSDDGYKVEKWTGPDGVRFRTGNTSRGIGDVIMFRGHVLMSCPIEFKRLLDEVGEDGSSGQRMADRLKVQVEKAGGVVDSDLGARGRNGETYVRQLSTAEMENR